MEISFDNFSIIISASLLLLAVVSPWFSSMARRPRRKLTGGDDETSEAAVDGSVATSHAAPSVSIVMAVHDNAYELEEQLPLLLEQQYAGDWEVIVVDESSTDDTQDVLTRLKAKYPRLYTTYVPASSHCVSRRKLALTIGIKAAKGSWILITDADCRPTGTDWLTAMSTHADDDHDLVMGYTGYTPDTPSYWRYDRLSTLCYQLRRMKRGTAYRNVGANLMFRKEAFIQRNGFLNNLLYLRGEYDFIVNEMATRGRTAFVYDTRAILRQQCPYPKTWLYEHLYYLESRRQMKRGAVNRLIFNTDQWMLYLGWLIPIAALVWAILTSHATVVLAAACSILLTLVLRLFLFLSACRQFGEHIVWWKAPWLELRTVWQNVWFIWRHWRADRFDFIRK